MQQWCFSSRQLYSVEVYFQFYCKNSLLSICLVLQASLNFSWCQGGGGSRWWVTAVARRWKEIRGSTWTSLTLCFFFFYSLSQCQQLDGFGSSEHYEPWNNTYWKKHLFVLQPKCLFVLYVTSWRASQKAKWSLHSAMLKRTSITVITVTIILSYLSEYCGFIFYWRLELLAAHITLIHIAECKNPK